MLVYSGLNNKQIINAIRYRHSKDSFRHIKLNLHILSLKYCHIWSTFLLNLNKKENRDIRKGDNNDLRILSIYLNYKESSWNLCLRVFKDTDVDILCGLKVIVTGKML